MSRVLIWLPVTLIAKISAPLGDPVGASDVV
jgi:hypothetical protein